MPRCQRLQIVGLCLVAGVLASACDPKPPAPKVTGASPAGIKPADSGVGGMSGPNGGSSSGGAATAPSGGDAAAPK